MGHNVLLKFKGFVASVPRLLKLIVVLKLSAFEQRRMTKHESSNADNFRIGNKTQIPAANF
jgi:hypothetical protein